MKCRIVYLLKPWMVICLMYIFSAIETYALWQDSDRHVQEWREQSQIIRDTTPLPHDQVWQDAKMWSVSTRLEGSIAKTRGVIRHASKSMPEMFSARLGAKATQIRARPHLVDIDLLIFLVIET